MRPPDEVEVLLPMDQVSLANRLLTQGQDVEVVITAHCCVEIELALCIVLIHLLFYIFVPNLPIDQVIPLVFFCVRADIARVLLLDAREVQYFGLFFLSLCVGTHFAAANLCRFVARREATGGEILRVQYPDLFLVAENEQQAL